MPRSPLSRSLLLLLLAGCATPEPADHDIVSLFEQSPLPGLLTLDAPGMYAGELVTLTASGARPGERIFFGLSTTGVAQQSVCPPVLQDCLNIQPPLTLLGSVLASPAGTGSIVVPVPPGAVYSSIFLQAASFSGTSRVAHRFIEPPDSVCGAGIAPPRCLAEFETAGSWTCGAGQSCQDVYDISVVAGTEVTIDVADLTGASVVRLAAFAPGVPLNGVNLLTNEPQDSECTGQNVPATQSFVAPVTGTYRVAVGRDWASSAGATGTYSLRLEASPGLDFLGQTVDDVASQAAGSSCGYVQAATGSWTCTFGVSCQDTYAFTVDAGDAVTFTVQATGGASVPRLALFEPGAATTSRNLLTGTFTDRECVGQLGTDTTASWVAPLSGTYTLAVGRDWGSSAGASGNYALSVRSSDPFPALSLLANDVPTGLPNSQCVFTWTESLSWTCAAGVSCQDVFEVPLSAAGTLTVTHTPLTGGSVSRLAAFAPGVPLSGTNAFTGTNQDQECAGQNQLQIESISAGAGLWRVAAGRDWGSSAGASGTYSLVIGATNGFPYVRQIGNDQASQAAGSSCL